jgi:hypothetical protein
VHHVREVLALRVCRQRKRSQLRESVDVRALPRREDPPHPSVWYRLYSGPTECTLESCKARGCQVCIRDEEGMTAREAFDEMFKQVRGRRRVPPQNMTQLEKAGEVYIDRHFTTPATV